LFAATRFQTNQNGPAVFTLIGSVENVWINGKQINPKKQFTVDLHSGVNIMVLRFPARGDPADIKLSSPDVLFLGD